MSILNELISLNLVIRIYIFLFLLIIFKTEFFILYIFNNIILYNLNFILNKYLSLPNIYGYIAVSNISIF